MFEEQDSPDFKKTAPPPVATQAPIHPTLTSKKRILPVVLGFIACVIIGIGLFYYLETRTQTPPPAEIIPPEDLTQNTPTVAPTSTLPTGLEEGTADPGWASSTEETRAENLSFGSFYKPEANGFKVETAPVKLPLYAKTDVSNYYDLSRKIDLTAALDRINKDGFAIIENPFAVADNGFYEAYAKMADNGIPQILTGDFLVYYYQNKLKEAFKEIESNVFYKDLWQINKNMFDLASTRYKKRRDKIGQVNDAILEGERLEAAYFAVSLQLLKPRADQISSDAKNRDENKFSEKEAIDFDFNPPDFLAEVAKEADLIIKAKSKTKSPVLLYPIGYDNFRVPAEYKTNARLHNFYMASRWSNSVFPLYYQSPECPDCQLDKNDWLIRQIAACLVTRDFIDNQELKNQWARIYKILSYFRGLRKDLTYLQYDEVLADIFGRDYNIERMFSGGNEEGRLTDLDLAFSVAEKIQSEISTGFTFPAIEGGYDRADAGLKPTIGMRMLQESYWPDKYVFSELTYPRTGEYLGQIDKRNLSSFPPTSCSPGTSRKLERCVGSGVDVINLMSSEPLSGNEFFQKNSNYRNYTAQTAVIKKELQGFNVDSWHNNDYWTTLDIAAKALLGGEKTDGPIYRLNDSWRQKEVSSALGSWLNLQLPADQLGSDLDDRSGFGGNYDTKIYVEPNLPLMNELMADTKMLFQMFLALKVAKEIDFTSKKMNDLYDELDKVRAIIKKELSGTELDNNDQALLSDLIRQTRIVSSGTKSLNLVMPYKSSRESLGKNNLLLAVYQLKDGKIILGGSVFNYQPAK